MNQTPTATILVVDDEADFRELVSRLLTASGFTVRLAPDCASALTQLEADPDIGAILLDLVLPGMTSRAFCARLRSHPTLSGVPIIVISGHPRGEERAGQLKSFAYFRKPFELPALVEAIRQCCTPMRRSPA